jgi:single-strand DNA-binding protein
MNLNHLVMSGNLTRDPETRMVGPERTVTAFTIAHNMRYKTQEGEMREEVTFVDCETWGRQGELAAQYLTKGALTVVEGGLRQDNWTDKEGQKRSKLKLRVERVHFAPRIRDDNSTGESEQRGESVAESPVVTTRQAPAAAAAPRPSVKSAPRPARSASPAALTDDPPF